jgi:O-acetyl-ADP-ribose deacetylase (regulator of RNase III)
MEEIEFTGKTIFCEQGDITDAATEAIVNAANNHLWMGAGVAGAIKRKGGRSIEDEAIRLGPIAVGEAVVTGAGKLKAKYVVHAAAMGQDLRTNDKLISETTSNALKQAELFKIQSIAFPALGTGVGGFPIKRCAELMIKAAHTFLQNSQALKNVGFILFDDVGYDSFADELRKYKSV